MSCLRFVWSGIVFFFLCSEVVKVLCMQVVCPHTKTRLMKKRLNEHYSIHNKRRQGIYMRQFYLFLWKCIFALLSASISKAHHLIYAYAFWNKCLLCYSSLGYPYYPSNKILWKCQTVISWYYNNFGIIIMVVSK